MGSQEHAGLVTRQCIEYWEYILIPCVKSGKFAIEAKTKLLNRYYTKITTYHTMVGSYFIFM